MNRVTKTKTNIMGLDITAHQNITKLECEFDKNGEPKTSVEYFHVYANPHFEGRHIPQESGAHYTAEKSFGFRAGSYSGYNNWREKLAELAGYSLAASSSEIRKGEMRHDCGAFNASGGPFWELINFSDCEGTIGTVAAQKLAKDFEAFAEKAASFGDDYWREHYDEWKLAFEMAAQNGCVCFH